jgi:RNA polymerase sigma factor (TIGR02999 family)
MRDTASHRISLLLDEWGKGDERALGELMPLVYDELRRMARNHIRRQAGHTFQTTELLHETYLKLAKNDQQNFQNRAHFFGVATTAMRHILVDYARSKQSLKRGGWQEKISFPDNVADTNTESAQVVALDDALKLLAELDKRKSRVVELKYFGGLTNEETAEVLEVSVETVKRDWRFARTWLLRELDGTKAK